ncbi:MAG TPA: hypothetical protein VMT37_11425 [Solirubrobacterales bacterium]|nr:hypothetical protein [Solirubrobacterales bacterium]
MAIADSRIIEHDFVELLSNVGRWPAGTQGTVVAENGEAKLIEIADERGQMLDLIKALAPDLKLIDRSSAEFPVHGHS